MTGEERVRTGFALMLMLGMSPLMVERMSEAEMRTYIRELMRERTAR